jgi:hypothetical protein
VLLLLHVLKQQWQLVAARGPLLLACYPGCIRSLLLLLPAQRRGHPHNGLQAWQTSGLLEGMCLTGLLLPLLFCGLLQLLLLLLLLQQQQGVEALWRLFEGRYLCCEFLGTQTPQSWSRGHLLLLQWAGSCSCCALRATGGSALRLRRWRQQLLPAPVHLLHFLLHLFCML